jgi:hypothetical protein
MNYNFQKTHIKVGLWKYFNSYDERQVLSRLARVEKTVHMEFGICSCTKPTMDFQSIFK